MQTDFFDHFPPNKKRLSEVCGPASYAFAAITAAHLGGKLVVGSRRLVVGPIEPGCPV